MANTFTIYLKRFFLLNEAFIGHLAILVLSIAMIGCPLAEPEALRPLATTKTDKYANKTASKPSSSACRLKKDQDGGEYRYDATGRLIQMTRPTYFIEFFYNSEGYLLSQVTQEPGRLYRWSMKFYYDNGILSKVEAYGQENAQSNAKLTSVASFESGRLKKVFDIYAGLERDRPFKTDGQGRVIETGPVEGLTLDGKPVIQYFEYDSNGNLTKEYDNSTSYYGIQNSYRYDNKPNPVYEATRFKGHPEVRMITYLGSMIGVGNGGDHRMNPNNRIYAEYARWNPFTNPVSPYSISWDFIYRSDGYPLKYTLSGSSAQHTYAEYENCN